VGGSLHARTLRHLDRDDERPIVRVAPVLRQLQKVRIFLSEKLDGITTIT
jgi:hypothetical protein